MQEPSRISSPAQPQWVAPALCFGSVAPRAGLGGLARSLIWGVLDGFREQPWRVGAPETRQMVRIVVNRERHPGQKVLKGLEVSGSH